MQCVTQAYAMRGPVVFGLWCHLVRGEHGSAIGNTASEHVQQAFGLVSVGISMLSWMNACMLETNPQCSTNRLNRAMITQPSYRLPLGICFQFDVFLKAPLLILRQQYFFSHLSVRPQ